MTTFNKLLRPLAFILIPVILFTQCYHDQVKPKLDEKFLWKVAQELHVQSSRQDIIAAMEKHSGLNLNEDSKLRMEEITEQDLQLLLDTLSIEMIEWMNTIVFQTQFVLQLQNLSHTELDAVVQSAMEIIANNPMPAGNQDYLDATLVNYSEALVPTKIMLENSDFVVARTNGLLGILVGIFIVGTALALIFGPITGFQDRTINWFYAGVTLFFGIIWGSQLDY